MIEQFIEPAALDANRQEFKTFVGMRHWHPYLKDTLTWMSAEGIDRAIGLVMAPHDSRLSIGAYYRKIEDAPIGFVVEHVEILYDIDVVFQQQAQRLGLHLERIEMLNVAPKMMTGLAGLVRGTAQEAGWL